MKLNNNLMQETCQKYFHKGWESNALHLTVFWLTCQLVSCERAAQTSTSSDLLEVLECFIAHIDIIKLYKLFENKTKIKNKEI